MLNYIASPEFWTTLGTALGGVVVATAILVWLGKTWIGERIKRDVADTYNAKQQQRKADFDKALEDHKSEISKSMEGWKAGYKKVLDENHIRFSKLHEDRATAIRRLFVRLVVLEEAVGAVVSPLRVGKPNEQKLRDDAGQAFNKFAVFFTHNRIFFTETDCQLIERIRDTAKHAYIDYTTYEYMPGNLETKDQIDQRQLQFKAYEAMTKEFPTLRKQLEHEFRAAMGLVEEANSKVAQ